MASSYLTKSDFTPSTNTSYTVSFWIKISDDSPTGSNTPYLWSVGPGAETSGIFYQADTTPHTIAWYNGNASVETIYAPLNCQRDPAAWYHVVMKVSSGTATLYFNGTEVKGSMTAPPLDDATGSTHTIHAYALDNTLNNLDCVMAHFHFIDGTAYNPSSFGETDATSGIWVPITAPSVTYGATGYFLKFASGALGTDSSGNGNNFTTSGTLTNTKDTPANNFATMNPLDNYYQSATFTDGNTTIKSDNKACPKGTIGLTSGKWYWEGKAIVSTSGSVWTIGISSWQTVNTTSDLGARANNWAYYADGDYLNSGSGTSYGDSYTTGDIIGIALDLTNNKLYFSKNGVWQNSGVPTSGGTGTGAISITAVDSTPLQAYFPAAGASSSSQDYTWSMNFGNGYFGTTAISSGNADDAGEGDFEYDVPAGYYAICTNNLGDQS